MKDVIVFPNIEHSCYFLIHFTVFHIHVIFACFFKDHILLPNYMTHSRQAVIILGLSQQQLCAL